MAISPLVMRAQVVRVYERIETVSGRKDDDGRAVTESVSDGWYIVTDTGFAFRAGEKEPEGYKAGMLIDIVIRERKIK